MPSEWTEYHEFRKRTDPPPYGDGKDDGEDRSAARIRDNDGHIHPPGHFCGSNCPKHQPRTPSAASTVREGQGGEDSPNYYVIVPATTFQTAERVMHEVGSMFDCHIIGAYAVDQDAPLMGSA